VQDQGADSRVRSGWGEEEVTYVCLVEEEAQVAGLPVWLVLSYRALLVLSTAHRQFVADRVYGEQDGTLSGATLLPAHSPASYLLCAKCSRPLL
jgi:hypothetical protein